MSDDSFFDNPLHKKTQRPSAAELANLAAALDPAGCRGNPKAALRTAARLWLRAAQICEALDAALNEDDLGTVAWYIAGEDKQPEETWRGRGEEELRGKNTAGAERLKVGTNTKNSEVLAWIRDNATAKKDQTLTWNGFVEEAKQLLQGFDPSTYPHIGIPWIKNFLGHRKHQRAKQRAREREDEKLPGGQIESKHSTPHLQPTQPSKHPASSRQKSGSRRQKGKK